MSLLLLLPLLVEGPEPEDVKAGPIAFVIFIGLILAVALLGFSLVKHLRKAEAAKAAGAYGDPVDPVDPVDPTSDRAGDPADGPDSRA